MHKLYTISQPVNKVVNYLNMICIPNMDSNILHSTKSTIVNIEFLGLIFGAKINCQCVTKSLPNSIEANKVTHIKHPEQTEFQ
jgi:hypothetical protein